MQLETDRERVSGPFSVSITAASTGPTIPITCLCSYTPGRTFVRNFVENLRAEFSLSTFVEKSIAAAAILTAPC